MGTFSVSGRAKRVAQHPAMSVSTWRPIRDSFRDDVLEDWVAKNLSDRWHVHLDLDAKLVRAAYVARGSWPIDHERKFGKFTTLTQVGNLWRENICEHGTTTTANCDISSIKCKELIAERLEEIQRDPVKWLIR
jgi:hypothetical protein